MEIGMRLMVVGCVLIAFALGLTTLAGIASVHTLVVVSMGYGLVAMGGVLLAGHALLNLRKK